MPLEITKYKFHSFYLKKKKTIRRNINHYNSSIFLVEPMAFSVNYRQENAPKEFNEARGQIKSKVTNIKKILIVHLQSEESDIIIIKEKLSILRELKIDINCFLEKYLQIEEEKEEEISKIHKITWEIKKQREKLEESLLSKFNLKNCVTDEVNNNLKNTNYSLNIKSYLRIALYLKLPNFPYQ